MISKRAQGICNSPWSLREGRVYCACQILSWRVPFPWLALTLPCQRSKVGSTLLTRWLFVPPATVAATRNLSSLKLPPASMLQGTSCQQLCQKAPLKVMGCPDRLAPPSAAAFGKETFPFLALPLGCIGTILPGEWFGPSVQPDLDFWSHLELVPGFLAHPLSTVSEHIRDKQMIMNTDRDRCRHLQPIKLQICSFPTPPPISSLAELEGETQRPKVTNYCGRFGNPTQGFWGTSYTSGFLIKKQEPLFQCWIREYFRKLCCHRDFSFQ